MALIKGSYKNFNFQILIIHCVSQFDLNIFWWNCFIKGRQSKRVYFPTSSNYCFSTTLQNTIALTWRFCSNSAS